MRFDRVAPFAVGLGATLVYLGTLTSRFAYDGVAYCSHVMVVLTGGNPRELFQANHLLFSPLAFLVGWLTGGAGAELALHVRLQMFQALLGGLTLALLFSLLRRWASGFLAGAVTAGVGATYAFWHFATDVEVYTLAALLLLPALATALSAVQKPSPRRCAVAGAMAGLAALGHIAHGAFGAATALLLLAWAPTGRKLRAVAVFAGAAAAVVVTGFAPLVIGPLAVVSPGEAVPFLLGYANPGSVGQHLAPPWQRVPEHLQTASRAVLADGPALLSYLFAVMALGVLAAVATLVRLGEERVRRPAVLILAWLVSHGVFFFSWDANEKYWIAAMIPAALAAALVLEHGLPRTNRLLRVVPALLGFTFLLLWNGAVVRRQMEPDNNAFLGLAREVKAATDPGATLLVSGTLPWLELKVYVPYFAERRTVVMDFALASGRIGELNALLAAVARGQAPDLFALDELVERPEARRTLEDRHSLPHGSLDRVLSQACPELERVLPSGSRLYRIVSCSE